MDNLEITDVITNNSKRVTVVHFRDQQYPLYVNEIFTECNKLKERWIQDWSCNDVTERVDKKQIYNLIETFYHSNNE
jgi:hypothetical protein